MFIIILFIGSAVIYGIIDYFRIPKPPTGLNRRELKHYYNGGWKEYKAQLELEEQLYFQRLEENEQKKMKLYHELEFLTARIAMLEDLQRIIELDLHNNNGNQKANLSRLISLDNQIHAAQKKVDKLNDELESLD